jgi:hypothetical protein
MQLYGNVSRNSSEKKRVIRTLLEYKPPAKLHTKQQLLEELVLHKTLKMLLETTENFLWCCVLNKIHVQILSLLICTLHIIYRQPFLI